MKRNHVMIIKPMFLSIFCSLLLLTAVPVQATPEPTDIPPALTPWKSWVLHGHEEELCPGRYNDGAAVKCRWPTALKLVLTSTGGRFELRGMMFAAGWLPLPGNSELWPENVIVNGEGSAVVWRENSPCVRLPVGEHVVMGRFVWQTLPEMLPLPQDVGLLSLTLNHKSVPAPQLDAQGRLWLQKREAVSPKEDEHKIQVFRRLDDRIPMEVTTLLRLEVSGKPREIDIEGGWLPQSIPLAVESPLPTRISDRKRLSVQARAGTWNIFITARMEGPQTNISAGKCVHGDEIWSFQPRHELRMVDLKGPPPVEPRRTEMPSSWKPLQAFLMSPDTPLEIQMLRRGNPAPPPDSLTLHRTYWLDFDGGGFTLHDRISGTLSRTWYLAAGTPMVLGRVSVDGQERVITQKEPQKKSGVTLRQGRLNLAADARLPKRSGNLPATGWDHDIEHLSAILNLPPGWRLLTVGGADSVSTGWFQNWSLLDIFMVIIIALAAAKIRSRSWGLLALATLTLIYHENGAPQWVWLHILAVSALLPRLPSGILKKLVVLWGITASIVLLSLTVGFCVEQIRLGIFPQLERPTVRDGVMLGREDLSFDEEDETDDDIFQLEERAVAPMERGKTAIMPKSIQSPRQRAARPKTAAAPDTVSLPREDPDAAIPTGPGLPDWHWQRVELGWNGPVSRDQSLHFYLLPPRLNLLLAVVRVGLLILLIGGLLDWRAIRRKVGFRENTAAALLLTTTLLLLFSPALSLAAPADFPPTALLDDLRRRLLEKPDCLPACADIARMEVTADNDNINIELHINTIHDVAVPLPVSRQSWSPERILLDFSPISALRRDSEGQLWALVPAGLHTVALSGKSHDRDLIQLPLPLRPHKAAYRGSGWQVQGIHPDGSVAAAIQLTRLEPMRGKRTEAHSDRVPPFLTIERRLNLGLTWRTTTTVTRRSPLGAPVVIEVPLLKGEAVTTAGITVTDQHAMINLAADQRSLVYEAGLKIDSRFEMVAPTDKPWNETWVLDAGSIWHCEWEGIPVVRHQNEAGKWQPRWHPWPGEKVTLYVQRPTAVKAPTRTIDRAVLVLTPGKRQGIGELTLSMRTSRGGQQVIELPPGAELQTTIVNHRNLPVRQEGRRVTLPLTPGKQQINLKWRQPAPFTALFKAPPVHLGAAAANADVTIEVPDQRWILLTGGPRWGPAVLMWSYLAVILLAAVALSRLPFIPLKTWQWVMLGLGLSQLPPIAPLVIAGWLVALGLRRKSPMPRSHLGFNGIQIALVLLTAAALTALFAAVENGLLGTPEMHITGNGSSAAAGRLNWTQDRVDGGLPRPWVVTLPLWCYRILLLTWSLWMALALLNWLKWGWQAMNKEGFWRKITIRWPKRGKATREEG